MTRYVRLSPKEYDDKFGRGNAYTYREEGKETIVYSKGGLSTGVKLHEAYHARGSRPLPSEESDDIDSIANEELGAEEFSVSSRGRGMELKQIVDVAHNLEGYGFTPNQILNALKKALRKRGYVLDDDSRTYIWNYLRFGERG